MLETVFNQIRTSKNKTTLIIQTVTKNILKKECLYKHIVQFKIKTEEIKKTQFLRLPVVL